MVRAIVDFNEADYERVRQAASDRGMTIESYIAAQAVSGAPETKPLPKQPGETWQEYFTWLDSLKLKPSGWKWNREELYDRKVLR